ncbi:hypothetical protein [Terracidiphilus gabretensis]|uniref:hypothetical protein n=1 Tax=Terracidiphilus gabretensis TaxID=1577687 RepID=UPI00071B8E04|nr:hypothetical protein [Terracidiphilus gabretensis]
MKFSRLAPLFILWCVVILAFPCSIAFAQDAPPPAQPAPPQKPSPDNPQPPVPQPAPDNPATQPQPPIDSTSQQPLPAAPSPAAPVDQNPYPVPAPNPPPLMRGEKYRAPWQGEEHWGPLSRVGIGADISPLGIGIKGAVILTRTIDARVMGNFLSFTTPNFDVDGTKATGTLRLASLQTAVDFYPRNSIWRLSAGALLWNGNQISAKGIEQPGTSFTLDGQTYYSSNSDPVGGSGVVGLHTNEPAFTASFGFGRFVPRSGRHWSFPSEFGVVFMGAPSLNINVSGTACLTAAETPATCSDVGDTTNPVGAAFQQSLQSAVARWRRSLSEATIYPIFSYGVVYSFTVRNK